jgi:UDP-N-acetylglucosamine 2-epimerase (non-hydrolysing)
VAPLLRCFRTAIAAGADAAVMLVHTGQHYDEKMSASFFQDLEIGPPDINLEVGSGSHATQTARVMIPFEELCERERPDWVVVVGDVNSTMACAITAKKLQIRVAHVEAGLRSRDMTMPEEINRLCTDVISDLLFTTDRIASENLRREGVSDDRIRLVGNVMIDTLFRYLERARALAVIPGLTAGDYAVVTLHRPANVDSAERLRALLGVLREISDHLPVLFPIHPRTRKKIEEFGLAALVRNNGRILLVEPMSYLPFISCIARARMVLTDSGGIQEETTVLGVPCLTMRPNTERPITCECGTNILVGDDVERIRAAVAAVMDGNVRAPGVPELWDGRAAERIVSELLAGEPSYPPSSNNAGTVPGTGISGPAGVAVDR